ncbi:MAG TPA: HEAT repeat domain-containing protein [Polyangiaceae bacterium]|jgi:HEAT repeat protein|nr:HEAT repeat domain-containing protein [Polyangiaceae bacterium]
MTHRSLVRATFTFLAALAASPLSSAQDASSDRASVEARNTAGRASVYQQMDQASLETLSTPDRLRNIAKGGFAPTEIWRTLEHGEKVECLDCIPAISKLLYDGDARTREISAWWLRRRIFGVFGPGQVYERTIATLDDKTKSEKQRAYAAEALGEFLSSAGTPHVARALVEDSSPLVRLSAVHALQRLNNAGPNAELSVALADPDEKVRIAALHASTRINAFNDIASITALVADSSSTVRTRALEALGTLKARDAVVAIAAKLSPANESSASVRAAAATALGQIGDASVRQAVQDARDNDPDHFVRDAASVALRQL